MSKKTNLSRLLALLCCMAMLLPCVPATLAADGPLYFDDFEGYADNAAVAAAWKKGGTTKVSAPQLGTERAFSGKQALLMEDTEEDQSFQVAHGVPTNAPAGTEIIMSVRYYVEQLKGANPRINMYTDKSTFFSTYSVGQWDTISGIVSTTKDNQSVNALVLSDKAPASKTYWDDVKVSVLTADLAVEYINEKIAIPVSGRAPELMLALNSKALGLKGVEETAAVTYLTALQAMRAEKGADLTKSDIETCIANIGMESLVKDIEGTVLSIGATGEVADDVVDIPGVTAKWVSVSPANKAITLSNGKAMVNTIPTGEDDIYSAVLRLSTANKSMDVNYTIRLVNAEGYNKEIVNGAKSELISNTVIGVDAVGNVAAPKVNVKGVTAQWDRIKADPNGCVSISNGQLKVTAIPSGVDYYEATVVLALTKGAATAELEYNIVVYNSNYRVLLPMINSGFEQLERNGSPTGWTLLTTSMGSYGEVSTAEARTGEYSMHMVDTATSERFGYKSMKEVSPAQEGYEYILTYWAKGMVTSEDPARAGISDYLEYNKAGGSKISQTEGVATPVSTTEWTLVSQWGVAPSGTKFIDHMPYSFVSTVCDVYMDDFRTWEITAEGSALMTDELLTGNGDADALYKRLSIKSLGASGLNAEYKNDYFSNLTAKRASKGSALTAAELAAGVKEVNNKLTNETKAVLQRLAAQVSTYQVVTKPGAIAMPVLNDDTVTAKITAVSGLGASMIRLTGVGARVDSLPAYGGKDTTATLTLTLSKGSAKVTVDVNVVLKALTKNMNDMFYAAQTVKLEDYLNGQSASCVTTDLKALPTSLPGSLGVKWQALDSTTLKPSEFMTEKGKVTRPAYGQPDAPVTLRATLSKGGDTYEYDLHLIVAAEGVEEARTVITRNTGFEDDTPKDKFTAPDGWLKGIKWENGAQQLLTSYANVVNSAFTGKQALRLTGGQTNVTSKGTNTRTADIMNSAVTTAREGYTYSLDVMAYCDSDTAAPAIILKFWDNFGLLISNVKTTYADAPGGRGVWKNLNATGVAPAGTIMITAELEGGIPEGQSVFDDVRLREWAPVANGSFDLDTQGWTTAGKVADGKLTLAAGQTAVSAVRGANRGVTYYLSMEADGGKAALRFVDKDGKTLAEYSNDAKTAFYAYAPANTAGVQVVLTGAMTVDNVKITRSSNGNNIIDGDFEISANGGVGTPWELTDATIAANTGKTGAGVTVKAGGKVMSNCFPVESGKTYKVYADVKGNAKVEMNLHIVTGKILSQLTATADSSSWTTLSISSDQLPAAIDGSNPEFHYAQLVFTGDATIDNVRVYSVTKNVSNYSVEDIKLLPYGTFPFHWSSFGSAATYVANQDGQATNGVKSLAVEMYGIGEGGVRSSYVQDIKSGKAYEAVVMAKGSGAKLMVEFWDQNFNKLGSEFVSIDSADWKEYSVIGTAPSGTIYATLAVGGDGKGSAIIDEASLNPVVRAIGNNVQTFVDGWFVADSSNVKHTLYEGESMGTDIMSPHGGYANIHWDPYEGVYKMWHRAGEPLKYRTSTDLINWSSYAPCYDKKTGAELQVGGYVHIDEDETDPNKRYKGVFYTDGDSRVKSAYVYYTSPDGVFWSIELDDMGNAYGPIGMDVHTMIYDEINDEYVMTYKNHSSDPLSFASKRNHRIAVSKDLMNWTVGIRQYTVGTPMDTVEQNVIRTDGYGNGMYAMGDSYVSLNWRTLLDQEESFGGQLDLNMLFSRDLTESWQRLVGEDGKAHMAARGGEYGDPDDGQMYSDSGALIVGDEVWWYIYCESQDHGYDKHPNYAGAYSTYLKWRLNGFASMDFSANGTLTTEQFTLMGNEIHVNAVGTLNVELLDASGNVVATGKFSGDSVDGVVTWDKSIASQAGKVVSLRFTSSDAKLYTVQVCGSIFSDVSEDAWYYRGVNYAVDNGIMGGYGGGKFGPNDTLSRAMVVQMLYNKVGQPKIADKHGFNDVPADQWFNNAVTWGTKNGVMGGYGNGKFGPNDNVTIEQIAVILWNYSGNHEFDAELGNVGSYSGWAKNALTWATDNGILYGVNFKNATDNATRAQAAQMLTNFLRW